MSTSLLPQGLTPYELEAIDTCNKQLHYEEGKLRSIIISCALILRDTQYVSQMLDINETINELMDLESYMEEREEWDEARGVVGQRGQEGLATTRSEDGITTHDNSVRTAHKEDSGTRQDNIRVTTTKT